MSRRVSFVALGLVGALGVAALVGPARAVPLTSQSTAPADQPPVPYQPPTGLLVNTPAGAGGYNAQQFAFPRAVAASFRAAVAGSTVWVSMFSWDLDRADVQADTLTAAKEANDRGVNVRVLLFDERAKTDKIRSLKSSLGTDTSKRSWVKVCKGACLGPTGKLDGVHHAKLLVFSKIAAPGGTFVTDLTFVGTANLTGSNAADSWNNTTVIPNDPTIAKAATAYISQMWRDKTDLSTDSVSSGIYHLDFYPRKKLDPDPVVGWLKKVGCKVPAAGYGRNKKTVVRVMMYTWTSGRIDIAKKLVSLRKAGCDVAVIVNNDPVNQTMSAKVIRTLLRGGVQTWNGRPIKNHQATHYTHAKSVSINGTFDGKPTKRVYSGSANFTIGSVTRNDEVILRTVDATTLDQFEAWFALAQAHSTRLRTVPATGVKSVGPDAESTTPDEDAEADEADEAAQTEGLPGEAEDAAVVDGEV